ncbi:MAG: hypothetical protein FJ031_10500 [Chloroflexi bacterium]|nr:hypothetical protein [Chloroflexota bacterium]
MDKIQRLILAVCLFLSIGFFPQRTAGAAPRPSEIPSSYQLTAENADFQLYVDSSTLAFKLVDKRSGYVWHSGIDETIEGDRLNKSWRAFAKSGISIEYLDEQAVSKRASIDNSAVTMKVTPIEQGVSAQILFEDYGISLKVEVRLEAEGVRVEIPADSIRQENPAFKLGLVYVYPFLGATRGGSTSGYMFLPDGTGSVIRFADATKAKNMFYGRYYGDDLGMIAYIPYDPNINRAYPISFPVFGMVHGEGQNAFLSVVEKGAAYGEVQAHPAGIITNFNFIYNAFVYNESYFQATNRSGAGVTVIQKQTNAFDAAIHFRFLTGSAADYIGMARSYQKYLLENGWLKKNLDSNPNMGIRLEFLGGDKERVLLWHRFVSMTTVRQMREILDGLQVKNPQVIYYGWQSLGASTMPPISLKMESKLGSLDELSAEAKRIAEDGGSFALYLDPQAALWDESGYSPRNDLTMAITKSNLVGYNRGKLNYYLNLEALQRRYPTLSQSIADNLESGLALDQISYTAYSDFKEGHSFNREESIQAYQALLTDSPAPLSFYRPNDYLWSMTRAYYNMPLGDNGYIYTSEAVPFLPIVLSGYIPCYGEALNFSPNLRADLLRHIDFGIYPSYFLTYEATAKMLNTPSSEIYTSSYAQWGKQIQQTYGWMNSLLAPVRGQEIIAREKLAEGVYATTYANGRQIVVNYTSRPFKRGALTVNAEDAVLWENQP